MVMYKSCIWGVAMYAAWRHTKRCCEQHGAIECCLYGILAIINIRIGIIMLRDGVVTPFEWDHLKAEIESADEDSRSEIYEEAMKIARFTVSIDDEEVARTYEYCEREGLFK